MFKYYCIFLWIEIISYFLVFVDKIVKLWKIFERCFVVSNFNLRDDQGVLRNFEDVILFRVFIFKFFELVVEVSFRRVYVNVYIYYINLILLNSDDEIYLLVDDLRINLWYLGINDQSYSIFFFYSNFFSYEFDYYLIVYFFFFVFYFKFVQ